MYAWHLQLRRPRGSCTIIPMWSATDWSESNLPGDSIYSLVEKDTESLHLWRIHSSRRKHKGDFLAFWTSTIPRSHLEISPSALLEGEFLIHIVFHSIMPTYLLEG